MSQQTKVPANMMTRLTDRLATSLPAGRNRRLAAGVATGILTKGVAFTLTLLTVPMTLHYLGPERYGIWVTMISMLAWLSMVDLGIANGLSPMLSAAYGKNRQDLARDYIATAFWSLSAIATLAGTAITLLWDWIDWGLVFNIHEPEMKHQISRAVSLAVCFFLLNLPFSINQRILLAYQQGPTANLWQLLVSLAGVIGIYLVTLTKGGLVFLVLGYSGAQLFISFACSIWLFGWSKPLLRPFTRPKWPEAKQVFSLGGLFIINQIATLLIFQKDIMLITHYLGPAAATPYSVTWQMFFYLNAIHILISPYLGPSFGEAFARGDQQWMRNAFGRYMRATCIVAVPAIALLTMFHRAVLSAWVGPDLVPVLATVYWMALWSFVLAILGPMVSLLVGVGRLKQYTIFNIAAATISLIMSIWLIKILGVTGVIAATVVSYSVLVVVPAIFEVQTVLGYTRKIRLQNL